VAGEWRTATVTQLQSEGILLVEDGNHGEYRPRPDEFVDRGVAFIRAADMNGGRVLFESSAKINDCARQRITKGIGAPGDVLLSHKGTVGKVALVPDDAPSFVCSPQTTFWRTRDERLLDRKYLYAFLRSPLFHAQLATRAGETDMAPYVSLTSQRGLLVALPPITEQCAIAHILGTLDDKIDLNRRMNETLEATARALFKSWFVDFDPVRAKAEGRDADLPKHLADLFPAHLVDSELGEIPEGWCVRRIEEVAERVAMGPFGASIKVETFVPDGVPIISGQHLRGFVLEDSTFNFISDEHAKRLANANVQRGDVIFTHAGSIGQAAFIPQTSRYERYVISQRQFYMRCDLSQVSPTFIAFYFTSSEGRHRLLANTSSSGVPSIARPVTYLRTIPLTIPTRPVLDAFEALASPVLLKFLKNVQINVTLAALRDALLPELVSGELRVKDAERLIGRVV